jgi:hypothetical protein
VTLVERKEKFISCPLSNLVLGGSKVVSDLTAGYDNLVARHGITLLRDEAVAIDPQKRTVKLGSGVELAYDRLVVARANFATTGCRLNNAAQALVCMRGRPANTALRRRLEDMPTAAFVMHIPKAPYRCPPGERSQVAVPKPQAPVQGAHLDANEDAIQESLFMAAWNGLQRGREYRPNSTLSTNVAAMTASSVRRGQVRRPT